jgi:soluble lytic murein transglycosylase-like protein
MRRKLWRWIRRRPWWAKALLILIVPVCALNLAVAYLGSTRVFLLSPFHLKDKAAAVGEYAAHRPTCIFESHEDLGPAIEDASRRHKLPPGLFAAMIAVESGTHAHRISPAGAMGPAQLMPGTARELDVQDPFNPRESLDGSARYLAQQLSRYKSVPLAVAAYNAGPGNVHRSVPRNGETEFYVAKVMAEYEKRRPKPAPVKRRRGNLARGE